MTAKIRICPGQQIPRQVRIFLWEASPAYGKPPLRRPRQKRPKIDDSEVKRVKIAVCDDDAAFTQKLMTLLSEYFANREIDAQICSFHCALQFLNSPLEQYDLVFLDVKLGAESGVEAARAMRRRNENAVLIFISAYLEYAPKGYEVDAFRYLLKDSLAADFPFCMRDALARLQARAQMLSFKTTDGETHSLRVADIWYLESLGHNVHIHTKAQCYCVYDTLSRMAAQLASDDFLRIQRSYYVNMRNVSGVQSGAVLFPNGRSLPGSRSCKALIHQKYLEIQGEC